jgi:hypothetical protein
MSSAGEKLAKDDKGAGAGGRAGKLAGARP